ncbi:hypothetical protein, partial [Bacteroides faecis]|uniref:hypothetical protein n=1 Tax=Bacteroides faecis TaxID=674529 RepID=UPI0039C3B2BA
GIMYLLGARKLPIQWPSKDTNFESKVTTVDVCSGNLSGCIQWLKDTNLKANHNENRDAFNKTGAVFNGSKILI